MAEEESREKQQVTLRILTFNVWFGTFAQKQRMEAIAGIAKAEGADVLAFQEVTMETLPLLRSFLGDEYPYWSDPPRRPHYFTMIAGSKRVQFVEGTLRRLPFQTTSMARDLLVISVLPCEPIGSLTPLTVATSHLESLNNGDVRGIQLEQVNETLAHDEYAIFLGDTNLDDGPNEPVPPLPRAVWADVMTDIFHVSPQSEGDTTSKTSKDFFTFDVTRNQMLADHDKWARDRNWRVRLDRAFVKFPSGSCWKVTDAFVVGKEPIADGVWPSDHFGLMIIVSFQPKA